MEEHPQGAYIMYGHYDAQAEQLRQARAKAVEMAQRVQRWIVKDLHSIYEDLEDEEIESAAKMNPQYQAAQAVIAEWGE